MQGFHWNRLRLSGGLLVPSCLLLLGLSGLSAQERPDVTARSAAEKRNGIVDPTYHTPLPHLAPPKETPAPAHWIWLGPVAGEQQVEARTTFTLTSKPRTAQVWVTADDAFTLFINGKKVEESPSVEQGWTHAASATAGPAARPPTSPSRYWASSRPPAVSKP